MENPKINNQDDIRSDGEYLADKISQNPYEPDIFDESRQAPESEMSVMFHNDAPGGGLHDQEDTRNADEATGNPDTAPTELEGADVNAVNIVSDQDIINGLTQEALDQAMGMDGDDADKWLAENDPENKAA